MTIYDLRRAQAAASCGDHPPRLPANIAPPYKWCIGYALPTKEPLASWKGKLLVFEPTESPTQCVKMGDSWWMWNKEGSSLIPYRVASAKAALEVGEMALPVSIFVQEPHEVIVIPDGILSDKPPVNPPCG